MKQTAIDASFKRIDAPGRLATLFRSPLLSLSRLALLLGCLALSHLWISRATPIVGALSPDRHYIAQVIARRDFPYLSPDGYLQVVDAATQVTLFKSLYRAGEDLNDLIDRIRGIRWRDTSVEFDLDDEGYVGPRVFVVPGSAPHLTGG